MTTLENQMFQAGFVRCPNNQRRWYAGSSGMREPAFPMELRVTDAIWLVTRMYGNGPEVNLMRFDGVPDLTAYLENNHRISQAAAAFSNSWD